MNQKLQRALKLAEEEVKNITPELKEVAFSKAVDYYLHQAEAETTAGPAKDVKDDERGKISFWEELSAATTIEIEKLEDIYSLSPDNQQIKLVLRIVSGDSKIEQQRNLAALILLGYHLGLNEDWVSSGFLAEAAKHSNLYSSSKFAENMRHNWFRTVGKKRWLKYKLSGPGLSQAKDLLSELTRES